MSGCVGVEVGVIVEVVVVMLICGCSGDDDVGCGDCSGGGD